MAFVVSILGVFGIVVGVVGLVWPWVMVRMVDACPEALRFRLAVAVRLVVGVVLLVVAPDCRAPVVVRAIGVLAIVAAAILLAAGQRRLDALIQWWFERPGLIRISAVFALAFGLLMIYAGA